MLAMADDDDWAYIVRTSRLPPWTGHTNWNNYEYDWYYNTITEDMGYSEVVYEQRVVFSRH